MNKKRITETKPAATSLPKPPADLSGEALAEWQRIVGELREAGLLDKTDRSIIHLYVMTWATWIASARIVQQQGATTVYSNNNAGLSKDSEVVEKQGKRVAALLVALGLTPSQRKQREAKQKNQADDPKAKRLNF